VGDVIEASWDPPCRGDGVDAESQPGMAREQHSQSCACRGYCARPRHFQPFPNFVAYATKFGNGSGGAGP